MSQSIKTSLLAGLALALVVFASHAEAKIVRATEMSAADWRGLASGGAGDLIVEFRQGDILPVEIAAQGDLLVTDQPGHVDVTVKRSFWLKVEANMLSLSVDGLTYKPFSQALTGSIGAGATTDPNGGPATGMSVMLNAVLK